MNSHIKQKRVESLLLELLNEAISGLSDPRLNYLSVVRVRLSKGKYDARVFLDSASLNEAEKKESIKALKSATSAIREYCLRNSGWFRCPKLHFDFDDSYENEQRLENIFDQIKKDKPKKADVGLCDD